VFYDKLIQKILDALLLPQTGDKETHEHQALTKHLLLDLLVLCVKTHSLRIRYFFIHTLTLPTLFPLLKYPAKCVRLDMLRLFRAIVGTKDEPLYRHIVRYGMFDSIFELMNQVGRDNILCASCLELFNYIVTEKLKTLMVHLKEKYKEHILHGKFASSKVFKSLTEKFIKLSLEQDPNLSEMPVSAPGKRNLSFDGESEDNEFVSDSLVSKSNGKGKTISEMTNVNAQFINSIEKSPL
jgi:hypothetical protein